MHSSLPVLGFFVGLLIGVTGMGGGAVMTPALILLGLARPSIAVGTDLVWGTLTKAVGAMVHVQQKNVDFVIVRRLAWGSIPGALAGLMLLAHLHSQGTEAMDRVLIRLLAVALICVSLSLFVRLARGSRREMLDQSVFQRGPAWLPSVVGGAVGFLVSLTSVGSGSMIVASLLVLYPSTAMRRIVGSDVVHGLFLVAIAALGHIGIGSVNLPMLGALLLGSIPGVWVGGKMTTVLPERVLQPILAVTLFVLGYKLL